eukprot:293352_1
MTTVSEANGSEMQEELEELAKRHKQAKLQAMIEKQDELRPIMNSDNDHDDIHKQYHINNNDEITDDIDTKSEESKEITIEDEAAMKNQFDEYSKTQLKKQITKQFLLRIQSSDEDESKLIESDEKAMKAQIKSY